METKCYYYRIGQSPTARSGPPNKQGTRKKKLEKPEQIIWLLVIHLEVHTEIFSSIVKCPGKEMG